LQKQVLEVDDLCIDISARVVKRQDKEIYLTRKEFEVLRILVKHVGMAVSRAMLMEQIWDRNADPFSNTIETHILNLRRKIDKGFARKLIQTVPGCGYKVIGKTPRGIPEHVRVAAAAAPQKR
jgi:DNA-binding response OmpR family regulator